MLRIIKVTDSEFRFEYEDSPPKKPNPGDTFKTPSGIEYRVDYVADGVVINQYTSYFVLASPV